MLWGFFLIHSISYRHFRWEFQPKESSLDLFPEAHKQTGPCAAQGGLASQAAGMPAQAQATCPPPLLAMPRRPAMPLWLPLLLLANGGLCNNSGGTLLPIKACPASMLWFGRTSDMWHQGWFRKDIRCGANNSSVFRHELNSSSVEKESFSWKWISSWVIAIGVGRGKHQWA